MSNMNDNSAMNSEETRLINEPTAEKAKEQTKGAKNKSTVTAAAAGAAGGFVAGAASGAATTAAASSIQAEDMPDDEPKEDEPKEESAETPVSEEQVLMVNDEGVRVAHVEGAGSFSEAFAEARQQVGPGGVFEYHGQIYGTYYADEWDHMSAQERTDFQHRASGITPTHHDEYHESAASAPVNDVQSDVAPDAQMISAEPADDAVRVLGVEVVEMPDGDIRTVAAVAVGDDLGLMVDVDNDGSIDVLLHDDNGDGQFDASELTDISEIGITVADLQEMEAAQNGDYLYAANDDMPDYVNDSDSIMTV